MADLGFWSFAQRESDALALVDPFENKLTRGELLADCSERKPRDPYWAGVERAI